MYDVDGLLAIPGLLPRLRQSVAGETPPPLLRDAKIKITSRCNLACVMCDYWKTTREVALSTEAWSRVLGEMAELGCRKVHFSGGEVFLRRDFLDLAERATSLGLKVNFTTNGTLIDREKARRIAHLGVNSVSISLDGPTARLHDAIRGQQGAFDRSVSAVRAIVRSSRGERRPTRVRINFVVMRRNFRKLPAMVRLAAKLGAVDLNPMPIDEKGRSRARLTRVQIEEYNRDIAPQVLEARQAAGFSLDPDLVYPFGVTPLEVSYSRQGLYARGLFERSSCLAPWLHLFLDWKGDAFLCCMTNGRMEPLGNVGRSSVREVYEGERFARVRQEFAALRHLPTCGRCDLFLRENRKLNAALGGASAPAASP